MPNPETPEQARAPRPFLGNISHCIWGKGGLQRGCLIHYNPFSYSSEDAEGQIFVLGLGHSWLLASQSELTM